MSPKRKRNESGHKRNVIKNAIVKGLEYVNYSGQRIGAKTTGEDCRCRMECFAALREDEKSSILTNFLDLPDKTAQDIYLMGLIESVPVKQRRSRKSSEEEQRKHSSSFRYSVMCGSQRRKVCLKAFRSLHAVGMKRVYNLTRTLLRGDIPKDRRGKNASINKVPVEIKDTIDNHIKCFPLKSSHYAGKEVHYLDARLDVKTMYDLYCNKYPDSTVKYDYYRKHFRENYNYRFGRPQIDTCSICEELNAKLKSPHINDNAKLTAKAELEIHLRRSRKFYRCLKAISEDIQSENVGGLAFDFMQNLPLPSIPVQETFYLRQLWVNIFSVHDVKSRKSVVYLYHQGEGRKGANEVCSFLYHYVQNYVPDNVSDLNLFSDSCPGQNRNHSVIRMCMGLAATGRFRFVTHRFPERGHSFLPCDRDFGAFKKKIKKVDRVYTPQEYVQLIANSKKGVEVHVVNHTEILNFDTWWPNLFKKTVHSRESMHLSRDKKQSFSPSSFKQFRYFSDKPGVVEASIFIDSPVKHTFFLGKPQLTAFPSMPQDKAYSGKVPIQTKKIQDIKKLVKYVEPQALSFYDEILEWPTTDSAENQDI